MGAEEDIRVEEVRGNRIMENTT